MKRERKKKKGKEKEKKSRETGGGPGRSRKPDRRPDRGSDSRVVHHPAKMEFGRCAEGVRSGDIGVDGDQDEHHGMETHQHCHIPEIC